MDAKKWAAIVAAVSAFLASIFMVIKKDEPVETPPVVSTPAPTQIASVPSPTPTAAPTPLLPIPSESYTLVPKNMEPSGLVRSIGEWWKSKDLDKTNSCYLQARLSKAIQYGEAVRFTYQFRTNVVVDGSKNIKDSRAYPSDSVNYTNHYTGRGIGSGAHQFTIETGTPDGSKSDGKVLYQKSNPNGWNIAYFDMPFKKDQVQTVVQELYFNSAYGKGDGRVRIVVDGVTKFDKTGAILNAPRRDFGAQMVNANPGTYGSLPAGSYYECRIVGLERIK